MIELRPYQRKAIEAIEDDGSSKVIVEMATGTGKTVVGACLAEKRGSNKVIVLAHREELLNQWEEAFSIVCPDWTTGWVKAARNDLGGRITLASIDTLRSRERIAQTVDSGPYDLVIVDEAHHSVAEGNLKTIRALESHGTLFVGLTATPNRTDNRPLKEFWQSICYRYDLVQAIAEGWLADVEGWAAKLDVNFDEVSVGKDGDFNEKSLAEIMCTPQVVQETIRAWESRARGLKTAIFAVNVEHARLLAAEMSRVGFPAESIDGEMRTSERAPVYQRFRSGQTVGIASCGVLTEGWDEKSVECILLARATMSPSLYVQMVGRGTRPFPGKEKCVVVDIGGNSQRHSLMQLGMLTALPPSSLESNSELRKADVHKAEPPDNIKSFSAYAREARKVDLVEGAIRNRRYDWLETRWGHAMDLGAPEAGYLIIRPAPESIGMFRIVHVHLEHGWKVGFDIIKDQISFNWAMGLAEQRGRQLLGGSKKDGWKKNDADWRDKPPTDGQMRAIQAKGLGAVPRTRAAAAKLLTEADFHAIMGCFGSNHTTEAGNRIRGHLKQILKDPNGCLAAFGVTSREQIDEMKDEEARRCRALAFKMQKDNESKQDGGW